MIQVASTPPTSFTGMESVNNIATTNTEKKPLRSHASKPGGPPRRSFKPSTVWDHFIRHSDGNVQCVHCAKVLKRKDSSTKTMWGHLRAIHFKGNDWIKLQMHNRNARLSGNANNNTSVVGISSTNHSTTNNESCTSSLVMNDNKINAQSWLETQLGINTNSGSLLCTDPPFSEEFNDFNNQVSTADQSQSSQVYCQNNLQQNNFMEKNAGKSNNLWPLNCKLNNINQSISSNADFDISSLSKFSTLSSVTNDLKLPQYLFTNNNCIQSLLQIAIDLDCTFTFNCHSGLPKFSFKANSDGGASGTSSHSNGCSSTELSVIDNNDLLNVIVSNGDVELNSETWKKTDLNQFIWAIRGKCQKILKSK